MKKIILFVLLLFSFNVYSQANNQANLNLIQLKFKLAFSNRDMFLRPCLVAESYCKLNATESKLGLEIINSSALFTGIDFQSSSQTPNLFIKDVKGVFQVVGTTNQKGAPVYVNLDRLMEPLVRLVGLEKVIEYVVSALYFQQTNNWEQSIQTAKKIGKFWSTKFKSDVPLLFKEESIEILMFKNKEVRIMLLDNSQAHIVSVEILRRMTCSSSFIPAILIDYKNDKWVDFQNKTNNSQGKFVTDLTYQCVDTAGRVEKWESTVSIEMHFEGANLNQKIFVPNLFKVETLKSQKIN